MGLHRWDGYTGYTDNALTILQELTGLCNECHGPTADECPCPVENVRKQCFDYLKEQLDIYRNRTNAGDYKQWCDALDAVLTAYSEHIKQPTICEWEPDDSHSLGGTLFHVNPAWDRFVQGVDALKAIGKGGRRDG